MAQKKGALQEIQEHSVGFALVFLLLFGVTFGFLAFVGATPDGPTSVPLVTTATTTPTAQAPAPSPKEAPMRIVAQKINLDVSVVNPTSADIDALDAALTKGAVRYPTSGLLGEKGTVLLFGHSSYLPVVYHQYYKTFDDIQKLKPGDVVSVYSKTTEYRYSVTGVYMADANTDSVELKNDGQYLTLVTCDSFSTKSNRFIVTARLLDTKVR
jgi:LPXTG-site transpeptidase (sortase) family protein